MSRDLSKNSKYCGTCEFWSGERKFDKGGACGSGVVKVIKTSGQCLKNKYNTSDGGTCKYWSGWIKY